MNHDVSYIEKFNNAINKTKLEGYEVPRIIGDFGRTSLYRTDFLMKLCHKLFMSKYADNNYKIDFTKLKGQCLNIHTNIQPVLERELNLKTILTIGSINIWGREAYKFENLNDIITSKTEMANVHSMPIHVWLTLPSYEIIDFTLLPHVIYLNVSENEQTKYKNSKDFYFLFNNSNEIHRTFEISYNPKYIGIDSINKTILKPLSQDI